MPGWYNPTAPSFAYHGDDGRLFGNSNSSKREYAGPYGKGDTIGCGVIYSDGIEGMIFYTRNGQHLGTAFSINFILSSSLHKLIYRVGPAFDKNVKGRLYPVIGMTAPSAITVNFGHDVESMPFKWELGNKGKYDVDAVRISKEEEPITKLLPIKFGISKPPI